MNSAVCPAPLDERELVEYWLGELAEPDEARIDEHLLGCGQCSARLGELVALAGGIRSAFRAGAVQVFLSEALVRRLAAQGLRLREYRVPRNGSVNCSVMPEDELFVSRLEAPLEGVRRVDVVVHPPGRPAEVRQDVPFDPARGEVVFTPNMAQLRAMPSHVLRLELVAVDGEHRRVIGDYTFNHTAREA